MVRRHLGCGPGLGRVGGRMDDVMTRCGEVTELRGQAFCTAIHRPRSFRTPVALRVGSYGFPENPTLQPPQPPLVDQP